MKEKFSVGDRIVFHTRDHKEFYGTVINVTSTKLAVSMDDNYMNNLVRMRDGIQYTVLYVEDCSLIKPIKPIKHMKCLKNAGRKFFMKKVSYV